MYVTTRYLKCFKNKALWIDPIVLKLDAILIADHFINNYISNRFFCFGCISAEFDLPLGFPTAVKVKSAFYFSFVCHLVKLDQPYDNGATSVSYKFAITGFYNSQC